MVRPASRQMSTSRVASATSVCAPRLEELAAAAERAGAEAQDRDLEARAAELSVFHLCLAIRTSGRRSASRGGSQLRTVGLCLLQRQKGRDAAVIPQSQ